MGRSPGRLSDWGRQSPICDERVVSSEIPMPVGLYPAVPGTPWALSGLHMPY